jgi:hypothetical protein
MIRHFINQLGRCSEKKMPGRIAMRTRQEDFRYVKFRTADERPQ